MPPDFHDELNIISVHQHVIDELKASLTAARSKQSLESQVDAIAKANAARLTDRPAMLSVRILYIDPIKFANKHKLYCSSSNIA